ncbi:unnamed protein product [Parascedosporium putredinis]|uniref:Enoyl reductase (ER) domain-containing protein n=1 Tax=Parascedosporium putredinis TaxID=1442378 RepID=A0A9P1ME32_9PEZI|nr:unnamed protein product [Parascedosporium putredinis]CAI8004860.1 unnamed protein product [Parascedosporium putredinis]
MKAYKLVQWGQPGEYVQVPKPKPGPMDVLIRVKASGLCRSDLDMMDTQPGQPPYATAIKPGYILGHETAGYVEELGELITDLKKGEAVILHHLRVCGFCEYCIAGVEQNCEFYRVGDIGETRGCGIDGGLAEFIVAPRSQMISLGTCDPVIYAPLADAGITAYSGCQQFVSRLRPGMSAVVIGVGGLGSFAVQFLKILSGAQVIAVDNSEDRLKIATDVGADATVLSGDGAVDKVKEITNGRMVDAVIDFVGIDQTLLLATKILRPQGHISVVGMDGGSVRLGWNYMPTNATFSLSFASTRAHLREVCKLAMDGKLKIDVDRFSFDQIPEAYDRLRNGKLKGRAVVVMDDA